MTTHGDIEQYIIDNLPVVILTAATVLLIDRQIGAVEDGPATCKRTVYQADTQVGRGAVLTGIRPGIEQLQTRRQPQSRARLPGGGTV